MLTRLAAGIGGLLLAAGAPGFASADPMDPVINTTCTYPQVLAALNAQDPAAAAQFDASPVAQGWLNQFLAAAPPQRQQMIDQAQSSPAGQPYVGVMIRVANTCKNF